MDIKAKEIVLEPTDKIIPNPKNPNRHSKEQIERLAKIIKYSGFRNPLVVSKRTGFLVVGHGRLEAAKKLGIKKLPVIRQDFEDEAQEYQHLVADNAIASWAELDLSIINNDIGELGPDFDLDLLGIKDFELEPADKYAGKDPDAIPDVKESICKPGDIWQLGKHRLMCGDSTQFADVEKLMSGMLAELWITDPPYGVSYKSNGAEDKHRPIENDSKPIEEMKTFWQDVAANAVLATSNEAAYYWFSCQGGNQMMMMMALDDASWKVRHELIWAKDRLVLGRCDYHYKHEPILYGWKKDGKHNWYGDRSQTSLLEFNKPQSSDLHPTMKPVELIEYLMKNSSRVGDVVYDSFLGSGTTLIACEKTNRVCYGMELDPHYCDVIIKRWENFTGQKATRL